MDDQHIPSLREQLGLPKQKIPNEVAINKNPIDPELKPFVLSYFYYNDKECQIDYLDKNRAKQCLKDLRIVGKCTHKDLTNSGIDEFPISYSGEYKKLYSRLPVDVELKEHKLQGTARVFYFLTPNVFHLVAITNSHYETDKNR